MYDDLGRLSQVTLPDGTVRVYGFDLDSNRTQIQENGQTVATYAYDTDGNTTAGGSDTLSWDERGRHSGGSFSETPLTYGFDAGGAGARGAAKAGQPAT